MTLTEEQLKAIALLLVASDRTKFGNFDLEDEQKARTILGAMIDSSGTVDTPPEEAGWTLDLEVLDRGTRSGLIDIEIAKKWHSAYRKAQNSNLLRKQENELLLAALVEHEEHENQTHEVLGNILGTDDSLENVAKRAAARIKELEDALVEELARGDYFDESQECEGYWWDRKNTSDCTQNDYRRNARLKLQAKGKIGPDADAKPREGLYGKYRISKADGSPVDPEADYFVLRLDTDPVARRAAREYSYMTVDRKLALELQERITKYNPKMMDCINLQFFGVEKPRVWQITEERKDVLRFLLSGEFSRDCECEYCRRVLETVRAMLTEAA